MLDLSLPDILIKFETWHNLIPFLGTSVLVTQSRQFGRTFDHTEDLILSLENLLDLLPRGLIILNCLSFGWLDHIDSLGELGFSKVGIPPHYAFNLS